MKRTRGKKRRGPGHEEVLRTAQEMFGLDRHGAEALGMLVGMCPLFEKEPDSFDDAMLSKIALMLAYPGVAEAIGVMASFGDDALYDLVLRVAAAAPEGDRAGAFVALASCEDERDNPLGAEAMIHDALADDPDFPPALSQAATFASERGEARRAVDLLVRLGAEPDDPELTLLRRFARPPRSDTPRNAPCPCGSGKKHKLCCLRSAVAPLEERGEWLYFKLAAWVIRTSAGSLMPLLATAMFEGETDPEVLVEVAMSDPIILDIAMFDEGLIEEFLQVRGPLLPADEAILARTWLETERSAFEVTGIAARRGYTLRDLISGRSVEVYDPEGWDFYAPLDILFGRVVPAGSTHVPCGSPTVVPRPQRHGLVAMIAAGGTWADIVSWRRAITAPPTLVTTEGEALVMCSAVYEVDDPARARAELGRYMPETEPGHFVSEADLDNGTVIRGWVEVEGTRVEITTNAVERLARLKSIVADAVPAARLVSEEQRDPAEVSAEQAAQPRLAEAPAPEVLEALDEHMARYEDDWVDTPVPALGGATPRDAVDDPSLRGELDALLDDMAWRERHHQGPGRAMDHRRLRSLLGI